MITPSLKPHQETSVSVQKIPDQSLQLLKNSPESFCAVLQVSNIENHFLSPSLNISQLQKELGELGNKQVRALLNDIVTDTVLFFQVGKMMGPAQVIETVGFILEDFKHLKPEDFILCFNKAKKGHYGQLFDRIDGQIILSWLSTYDNERTAAIESIRARENREIKQATTVAVGKPDDEKYQRLYDEYFPKLIQKLDDNKKLREGQKLQAVADRELNFYDPIKEMHLKWIEQFDKLWIKQGAKKGVKLVRKYGKVKNPAYFPGSEEPTKIRRMLDLNAYLEHKQKQYNAFVVEGRKPYQVKIVTNNQ